MRYLLMVLIPLLFTLFCVGIVYIPHAKIEGKFPFKQKELTKAELVRQDHQRWNLEFMWAGGKLEELPPRNGKVWNPDAPMPQLQAYDTWTVSGRDMGTLQLLMDACPNCTVRDAQNWTLCPECAKHPAIMAIVRRGIRKTG